MATRPALVVATVVAAAWLTGTMVVRREAEVLSAFMLGSYGLMLAIAYLAEDERVLLLRDPATSGLAGLVFLVGCAVGRPATWYLARRLHGEAATDDKRAHTVQTLVWGCGLLGESLVRVVLIFVLPPAVTAGLSTVVELAVLGVLLGWTIRYRALRSRERRPRPRFPRADRRSRAR